MVHTLWLISKGSGKQRPGFVARGDARGHGPRKGKWTVCSSRRRPWGVYVGRLTFVRGGWGAQQQAHPVRVQILRYLRKLTFL